MANSKYEYVRSFEQPDNLLPSTFIVVRIDGRGFTKLTTKYDFAKPNDRRALDLMNAAAVAVMKELPDLVLAYGQSDEFSFIFHKDCMLFERRASKLVTTIVSTFTANYVLGWATYFPDAPLTAPLPSFDGRAVCYPSNTNLRDYLSWRQADCHINNLYNTTFWALVKQGGLDNRIAEKELSGTVSSDKNEILFNRFGINYNNEPDIFKKGSVLYRDFFPTSTQSLPAAPVPTPSFHNAIVQPIARPLSQQLERTHRSLLRISPASGISPTSVSRGPTFLSTSTTPSPPPSPPLLSMPTLGTAFESYTSAMFSSISTPAAPSANGPAHRHHLSALTPIPLPPPTLKPSTRPPLSLNPPNSVSHTNTSPITSIYVERSSEDPTRSTSGSKQSIKQVSHSASASLSMNPSKWSSLPSQAAPPKRSPSMGALDFSVARKPPEIPLRISSIPLNRPPRKLSLPEHRSYSSPRQENDEIVGVKPRITSFHRESSGPRTPPKLLMTMKELPSPPIKEHDEDRVRGAFVGSKHQARSRSSSALPPSRGSETSVRSNGHAEMEGLIVNPVTQPSPPQTCLPSRSRTASTASRTEAKSYTFLPPLTGANGDVGIGSDTDAYAAFDWASKEDMLESPTELPPKPTEQRDRKAKKVMGIEDGVWDVDSSKNEGRPAQVSKRQKEKDKKKRLKAKIMVEHVDIIGDKFWERKPWILSGRAV